MKYSYLKKKKKNGIPAFCFNKKSTKKSGFIKPKSEGVVESGFTFKAQKA